MVLPPDEYKVIRGAGVDASTKLGALTRTVVGRVEVFLHLFSSHIFCSIPPQHSRPIRGLQVCRPCLRFADRGRTHRDKYLEASEVTPVLRYLELDGPGLWRA